MYLQKVPLDWLVADASRSMMLEHAAKAREAVLCISKKIRISMQSTLQTHIYFTAA